MTPPLAVFLAAAAAAPFVAASDLLCGQGFLSEHQREQSRACCAASCGRCGGGSSCHDGLCCANVIIGNDRKCIGAADTGCVVVASSSNINVNFTGMLNNSSSFSVKRQQILNYRRGEALMLLVHATHHGGTTFCGVIGKHGINNGTAPNFACMGDRAGVMPNYRAYMEESHKPWSRSATAASVAAIRPYFHMVAWEFSTATPMLENTEWEHPKLLSVVITRDPMSRLLAGDGRIGGLYPGYNTGTLDHAGWWRYATDARSIATDNFFLRIIGGETSKASPTLNRSHFEHAAHMLRRFTFVLDVACLNEGMLALAKLLTLHGLRLENNRKAKAAVHSRSTRERIGFNDIYQYLVKKNEWDIELYEYSKTISLVRCDALPSASSSGYTGRWR